MSVIITSVFVMIAAILIRKAFSKKLSGRALMVIWAIVFVKLAIPVSIPAAFSVMNLFAEEPVSTDIVLEIKTNDTAAGEVSPSTALPDTLSGTIPFEDDILYTDDDGADIEDEPAEAVPAADGAVITVSFREALRTVYAVVAAVLAAGVIIAYAVCAVRFAVFEEMSVPERFAEKGVVFRTGSVGTPAVFGIFRPVILFPNGTDIDEGSSFEHIILHEKTHIRHRDQLFNLLTLMICCLNWYDPLAWICRALYLKDVEKWCDESVLEHIGKANRKAYAESLLACAAERSSPFVLVSGFGENDIKGRVISMMYDKKLKRGASAAVVALTAVLFAAFGTGNVVKASAVSPTEPADDADNAMISLIETKPAQAFDISTASTVTADPDEDGDEVEEHTWTYEDYLKWKENLEPEKILTTEIFKEFLSSDEAKKTSILMNSHFLFDPLPSGEVMFSEPFRIPTYNEYAENNFEPSTYEWYSAIFQNDKLYALLRLSYDLRVMAHDVLYLPYDLTESIDKGDEISLFFAEAVSKVNGYDNPCGLFYYNIDKSGSCKLVNKQLSYNAEIYKGPDIKTTKEDYDFISGYNILSKDMEKIASAKNVYGASTDIKYGGTIMLENWADEVYDEYGNIVDNKRQKWCYIVHPLKKDKNGEVSYWLSTEKDPEKAVRFAGCDRVYLRCVSGGTAPLYRICSADEPQKVLTLSDGRLRMKRWTQAPEQEWFVTVVK